MMRNILVPHERIAVVIGPKGRTKYAIQRKTKAKLNIEENMVTIEGEAVDVISAETIIKAISRGFSPDVSLLLADEDFYLEIIDLPEKGLVRIKSRIIGTSGKSRRIIEKTTHTAISVYGKTVSIIGRYDDVQKAKQAVEKLISGSSHKVVYNFLES